jgi:hypothetical protein
MKLMRFVGFLLLFATTFSGCTTVDSEEPSNLDDTAAITDDGTVDAREVDALSDVTEPPPPKDEGKTPEEILEQDTEATREGPLGCFGDVHPGPHSRSVRQEISRRPGRWESKVADLCGGWRRALPVAISA